MPRTILTAGVPAIWQTVEILSSIGSGGAPNRTAVGLEPGTQWRRDHLLLAVGARSVKYVAGSVVCEQDLDGFLREQYSDALESQQRAPAWMLGLSRYEIPFCMTLAGRLAPAWGGNLAVCPFLDRFGFFYRANRTHLELAARELHHVLDGLFAVQSWPGLFGVLLDAMGEGAAQSLPRGIAATDIASFLGRLLVGNGPEEVSLARLPELLHTLQEMPTGPAEACRRIPHYRRILENLERSCQRVSPVLAQLRAAL